MEACQTGVISHRRSLCYHIIYAEATGISATDGGDFSARGFPFPVRSGLCQHPAELLAGAAEWLDHWKRLLEEEL